MSQSQFYETWRTLRSNHTIDFFIPNKTTIKINNETKKDGIKKKQLASLLYINFPHRLRNQLQIQLKFVNSNYKSKIDWIFDCKILSEISNAILIITFCVDIGISSLAAASISVLHVSFGFISVGLKFPCLTTINP